MDAKPVAAALLSMIVTAGCGDSPSCETAVRHVVKLMPAAASIDEADVATMVATCTSEKWAGSVRSCLAKASSLAAASRCTDKRDERDEPAGGGRVRRSEAEINLSAIGKVARAEYAETATFPQGTVALTPAQPCCEHPGKKCQVLASDWQGVPAWDALGFEITEPSFFQYAYTSDGRTFEASAVGDLDCDGTTVTYTLRGRVDDSGVPTVDLTKPDRPD